MEIGKSGASTDYVPMFLAIRELDSAVQYVLVATTLIPEDAVFGVSRAC